MREHRAYRMRKGENLIDIVEQQTGSIDNLHAIIHYNQGRLIVWHFVQMLCMRSPLDMEGFMIYIPLDLILTTAPQAPKQKTFTPSAKSMELGQRALKVLGKIDQEKLEKTGQAPSRPWKAFPSEYSEGSKPEPIGPIISNPGVVWTEVGTALDCLSAAGPVEIDYSLVTGNYCLRHPKGFVASHSLEAGVLELYDQVFKAPSGTSGDNPVI